MAYKDLVAMLKKGGAVFHYHNSDLTIFAKVKHFVAGTDCIVVEFEGGGLRIWRDSKVRKVERPANLLIECEECFEIHNSRGEHVGYILRAN